MSDFDEDTSPYPFEPEYTNVERQKHERLWQLVLVGVLLLHMPLTAVEPPGIWMHHEWRSFMEFVSH